MDTKQIESLMQLCVKYKVDRLVANEAGIEIIKTKHDVIRQEVVAPPQQEHQLITDNDELLFWSSSSPALTVEQIEQLSLNGADLPTKKKTKRIKASS